MTQSVQSPTTALAYSKCSINTSRCCDSSALLGAGPSRPSKGGLTMWVSGISSRNQTYKKEMRKGEIGDGGRGWGGGWGVGVTRRLLGPPLI